MQQDVSSSHIFKLMVGRMLVVFFFLFLNFTWLTSVPVLAGKKTNRKWNISTYPYKGPITQKTPHYKNIVKKKIKLIMRDSDGETPWISM